MLTFISLSFDTTAEAVIFGGSRTGNSRPTAWYSSSVGSHGYTSNFDKARNYWNAHSKVNITKSSTSANSDRYYVSNTSTSGLLGIMTPYTSSGNRADIHGNWNYATVHVFENSMRSTSNYSASRVNYNIAHEIGHSIKMAHASKAYHSVMPQSWITIPSSLTVYDRQEIDRKW